jgi:ribulose 1,5-bisphosphate synthetase/thiazole synthase
MQIIEAYNDDAKTYSKVLVYLHGGGMSGAAAAYYLDYDYFGEDISDLKIIFPTSTINGGVWY